MLNKRLRKQIEQHFYSYKADCLLSDERVQEIAEAGLIANYSGVGGGGAPSDPTWNKAIKLAAIESDKTWTAIVRNTFIAFRFEPELKVMVELYIKERPLKEILCDGLWENTFYRWRDNWLEYAYKWAKKFKLL